MSDAAKAVVDATKDLDKMDVQKYLAAQPAPSARRTRLDVTRPKGYSGLWSALKSAVGHDLSKIAMPVQFNEPLSFLQRLTEDLEYHHIADAAAACKDPLERLAHVCAFASTMFASNAEQGVRIYKAFNPLLGETFEMVRKEHGYRLIAEQVSHHPPISAIHCDSEKGWIFHEEYKADTRFRGSLKVVPESVSVLEIPAYNDVFSWGKPTTTVHNLIFGTLWVDQEGDIRITNHTTGDYCLMAWEPHSKLGNKYLTLTGRLFDKSDTLRHIIHGRWDQGLVLLPADLAGKLPTPDAALADKSFKVLWQASKLPEECRPMYGMPEFSIGLNAFDDDNKVVCPTDSRHRPDQRLLEDGKLDDAAKEKTRLEQKQRAARKIRDESLWVPLWFEKKTIAGEEIFVYKGGFWDAKHNGDFSDKSKFPDIF